MRINIVICNNPFVASSASANRWLTLIEGLSELDVQIQMLVYGGYLSEYEMEKWGNQGENNQVSYKYIAPQLMKGYIKLRYHAYLGSELRKKRLIKYIIGELSEKDGIVWTDSSQFGFQLATTIRKTMPQRLIFLEMSEFLDIHKYNKGNFLQRWKGERRQKYFETKAFKAYDGIALMTKTLFEHYRAFPQPLPKFLHLPMTVDLDRFEKTEVVPAEFIKPYIAFVGVMNDAKDGVNILIDAFSKLHRQFQDYKLYLIGAWNYDTPAHLIAIKNLGLTDKVFWMKEYPRDRIPAIIKNADLLVLPRPDSKQAQGGFPTKLGEYLATGNPVCATTVGEIPEYLKDSESVYFAQPGSVDSFADAMRRALSDPEEAKRIGAKGRKIAEIHFNKDIQAKKLFDFLESLTNDHPTQQ